MKVVRPGAVTLLERVAAARAAAERETYGRVVHLLTEARRAELDGLLVTDPEIGMSRLRWLNTGPTEASAAAVKTEVAKLLFLRGLDARTLDLSALPAERRRFLAAIGRLSPAAKLARRDPERRIRSCSRCWPSPRPMCSMRWCSCSARPSRRRSRRPGTS